MAQRQEGPALMGAPHLESLVSVDHERVALWSGVPFKKDGGDRAKLIPLHLAARVW